jgi:hypothetical protein
MIRDRAASKSAVRAVTFVWIIPNTDQLSWIAPELAELVRACPATLELDLQIYVTRAVAADVPVLAEKDAMDSSSSGSSARTSAEISRPTAPSSSNSSDDLDEKAGITYDSDGKPMMPTTTGDVRRFARAIRLGRPDFGALFKETIAGANGGAMSVNSASRPASSQSSSMAC